MVFTSTTSKQDDSSDSSLKSTAKNSSENNDLSNEHGDEEEFLNHEDDLTKEDAGIVGVPINPDDPIVEGEIANIVEGSDPIAHPVDVIYDLGGDGGAPDGDDADKKKKIFCHTMTRQSAIIIGLCCAVLLVCGTVATAVVLTRRKKKSKNKAPDVATVTVNPSASPSLLPSTLPSTTPSMIPSTSPTLSSKPTVSFAPSLSSAPTDYTARWFPFANKIAGAESNNFVGGNLVLSEDSKTLAVSAMYYEGLMGHVRVFKLVNTTATDHTWVQLGNHMVGTYPEEEFGRFVGLSGDGRTIAIGAPVYGAPAWLGRLLVYSYNDTLGDWQQKGSTMIGERNYTLLGDTAMDLNYDGSVLVYGNKFETSGIPGGKKNGVIRTYQFNTTSSDWELAGPLLVSDESANETSFFGDGLIMNSDATQLVVSDPFSDIAFDSAGRIQRYKWNQTTSEWVHHGNAIDGLAESVQIGRRIAASEDMNIIAHTSNYYDAFTGFVEVFRFNETSNGWDQMGQTIYGDYPGHRFSYGLALSNDGLTLAACSSRTTVGDDYRNGNVETYNWDEDRNEWMKNSADIFGDDWDAFGSALAMSGDGKMLVSSARFASYGNFSRNGVIKTYEYV